MRKKNVEVATIGCIVGLCALYSEGCRFARLLLVKLSAIFHGRGEEGRSEGAS